MWKSRTARSRRENLYEEGSNVCQTEGSERYIWAMYNEAKCNVLHIDSGESQFLALLDSSEKTKMKTEHPC